MTSRNQKYFASDPDWEKFAAPRGYALQTTPSPEALLDVHAQRKSLAIHEDEWQTHHHLEDVGYQSSTHTIEVRDGHPVEIKVSRSTRVDPEKLLPLVFVTHGGGWIEGTHVTEEAWLLWPLYLKFDLTIISVDYRCAPEHKCPFPWDDCWDVFQAVIQQAHEFKFDDKQVILAGSSAGGGLAAGLSQQARDAGIPIYGTVLNVPITCDPRHFPSDEYQYTSYEQCFGTFLSSGEIRQIWDVVVPNPNDGKSPRVSPLLGDVDGLPPHLLFVAGQDPLRDEAIAYGEKLKANNVDVEMHIYQGVPHSFAEFWELNQTKKFWDDLQTGLSALLAKG